jgi:transcription elongation factor Elf1
MLDLTNRVTPYLTKAECRMVTCEICGDETAFPVKLKWKPLDVVAEVWVCDECPLPTCEEAAVRVVPKPGPIERAMRWLRRA